MYHTDPDRSDLRSLYEFAGTLNVWLSINITIIESSCIWPSVFPLSHPINWYKNTIEKEGYFRSQHDFVVKTKLLISVVGYCWLTDDKFTMLLNNVYISRIRMIGLGNLYVQNRDLQNTQEYLENSSTVIPDLPDTSIRNMPSRYPTRYWCNLSWFTMTCPPLWTRRPW
jgi:hypothetical protein